MGFNEDKWVDHLKNKVNLPPMPWYQVQAMSDSDLRSVYLYIKSLGPPGELAPFYRARQGAEDTLCHTSATSDTEEEVTTYRPFGFGVILLNLRLNAVLGHRSSYGRPPRLYSPGSINAPAHKLRLALRASRSSARYRGACLSATANPCFTRSRARSMLPTKQTPTSSSLRSLPSMVQDTSPEAMRWRMWSRAYLPQGQILSAASKHGWESSGASIPSN